MSAKSSNAFGPVGPMETSNGTDDGPESVPAKSRKAPKPKTQTKRAAGTGGITREPDGTYRVKVLTDQINPDTGAPKYVKCRAKTYVEAVASLNDLITKQGTGMLRPGSTNTLGSYLRQWVEVIVKPTLAPSTYKSYEETIRLHVEPNAISRKKLTDVKSADVQSLLTRVSQTPIPRWKGTDKEGTTYSRRQVEIIQAVLKAAFNHAVKRDRIINYNPAEGTSIPRNVRKSIRREGLSTEHVQLLLDAIEPGDPYGRIVLFMLGTGARAGEAIGIRWSDIDFPSGTVLITGQLQRVKGKGMVYRPETKTGQSRRLKMADGLVQMLQDMAGEKALGETDVDPEGIVFLNSAGSRMDSPGINRRLKTLCRKAGIPEISPHVLRHTSATVLLEATGDIHSTAKFLGHSQTSQTTDRYGHLLLGRSQQQADVMQNAFFANSKTAGGKTSQTS